MLQTALPRPKLRPPATLEALGQRIDAEFREMPGMSLTEAQARRLFNLSESTCSRLLSLLVARGVLRRTEDGQYRRGDS
jgi:DNA-binding IclR family transcriptional regulator